MQINAVVDVAIGLVALFWIVATAASFAVEALSSMLNIRGKALELFVREMVLGVDLTQGLRQALGWLQRASPSERPSATGAAVSVHALDITDHPLIRRLGKPSVRITGGDTPPSYIPADLFGKALVDRLREVHGGALVVCEAVLAARASLPQPLPAGFDSALASATTGLQAASAVQQLLGAVAQGASPQATLDAIAQASTGPARLFWQELAGRLQVAGAWTALPSQLPALAATIQQAAAGRTLTVADLQAVVASGQLPAPLQASLRPLLDAANHDMQAFLKGVEGWYDSVMDRASGWFRRYAQALLLVAAFLISAVFNLDTLYIGQRLALDHEARAAAVKVGEAILAQGEDAAALVPAGAFYRRYAGGDWQAGLSVGEPLPAANALALQVQPMLLVYGGLLGPMMELQAAALQIETRCSSDCSKDTLLNRWADQQKALDALSAAWCRGAKDRPAFTSAQREWVSQQGDEALADPKTPSLPPACATLARLVRTEGRGPADTMKALWSNTLIVWHAELGSAAWSVRQLAAAGGSDQVTAQLEAFRTRMSTAVASARGKVETLDKLLSHLPHVGFGGVAGAWKAPAASGWAWVFSVIGWSITAFMAALGAPLWFDLLGKLTSRRITGPKPEVANAAAAG